MPVVDLLPHEIRGSHVGCPLTLSKVPGGQGDAQFSELGFKRTQFPLGNDQQKCKSVLGRKLRIVLSDAHRHSSVGESTAKDLRNAFEADK